MGPRLRSRVDRASSRSRVDRDSSVCSSIDPFAGVTPAKAGARLRAEREHEPLESRPAPGRRSDRACFHSRIARSRIAALILFVSLAAPAPAREAVPEAADPALEARMVAVASELRCLVCQNQTIADSHADLAVDLRRQVREQLQAGRSDAQIVDYMTARYGDFVLYRPPFKPTTALLWLGPALMLGGGLAALAVVLRRRARLAPDAFEPHEDDDVLVAPVPARFEPPEEGERNPLLVAPADAR